MPPRLTVQYRGESFEVALHPELAHDSRIPWCVDVAGGLYDIGDDPDGAQRFLRDRLHAGVTPRRPAFLASLKWPLLLLVDGVPVVARPLWIPRGSGAKTFLHPTLNRRVATERGPFWVFSSAGRDRTECGTVTAEQSVADVEDLAKLWLRSSGSPA